MEQENSPNSPKNFRKKLIYIFILILIILTSGYYLYFNIYKVGISKEEIPIDILKNNQETTTTEELEQDKKIGEIILKEGQSYEYVGVDKELVASTPIPDLNRKIPNGTTKNIKGNIISLSGLLKADSKNFDLWINLGSHRKMAGDHEGAKQAWEYAGILRPRFSLSFLNLANLYGYYLKDSKKAESNFLKAIEVEPTETYSYVAMANFYIEVLNNKNKAIDIIKEGIKNNPKVEELKQVLIEFEQK
ncbi:hypothetical protein KJ828_01670 [Patescibacteria group bacterium]|nr:hypothetical protein [Patescibacteria group bacterium]